MFTGLIQAVGTIVALDQLQLIIEASLHDESDPIQLGESIAVSGCCLTVARQSGTSLEFDLSEETLARTAFSTLMPGTAVNLERAMRASDRLGGHFVLGHVDAVGKLVAAGPTEGAHVMRFRVPESGSRFLVDKGSIALDGVSLTVVQPEANEFSVWLIPHTMAHTAFQFTPVGSSVNVEYDVLAKHVDRLINFESH